MIEPSAPPRLSDHPESASAHRSTRGSHGANHAVRFYEDEDFLCAAVASFLEEGILAGDPLIVIATKPHADAFRRRLESDGVDIARLCQSGQLIFLDAHETLSKLMRDGEPDPGLFQVEIGELIAKQAASAGTARLRAYGEMVDVLWMEGHRKAALHLEELWNGLQSSHSFTLLCAYAMASFYTEPDPLQQVCSMHTHVSADDGAGANDSSTDRRATALLPQYARQLAREIAQRKEVEQALRESLREQRRKEAEIRQSEEHLRDFVENAPLGLHSVGPDGTILWANRTELELLGYTREEYIGRPISEMHADREVIEDILARLTRGEELHNYEARLRAKDGSIKHVLISSNVYSRDGRFIHTRCFTRDITPRKKAEEALRQSERQLQSITDALPVLVAYVGADGRYEFASAAYERWFGYPKAEILGKHIEEVVGAAAYQAIRPHMERALSGQRVTYEAELPYRVGGTRFIEATYIPLFRDGGHVSGFVALVADITERKGFDFYRAAAAARAERLQKITAAVADAVTTTEVFEAVVDHVAASVDASTIALWLVDEDGRTARLVRAFGYSESSKKNFEVMPVDASPSIPVLDSIRRGEPIWIPSQQALLGQYPHLCAAVTMGRSYRVSALPLISHGRTLGALGLTIEEAREATEEERSFLLLVARYASQAIERVRLFETERRSRAEADAASARMSVLSHASRTFVKANLDLNARLQDVVRELGTILSSAVGVALLQADGRLHTAAVHHSIPEAQELLRSLGASAPLRIGEGVAGSVASSGKSVLIPATDPRDIAARAAPSYRTFLERYPMYAMICAPLQARGRIIGTVTATRAGYGETYTHADLELLEELADRAASVIENGRLYQENLDARSRAEQLHRFAQTVVTAEKIEQVFDAALDAIAGALGTNRAAILLFDDDGVMRFRASRHLSDDYRRAVEGHSPWPRDAVAPQPVLVTDVENDPTLASYLPMFRSEGIGSLAFIPLVTRGQLLGKFMVYHGQPHTYSTNEIELASAIAIHLASVSARFAAVAKLEETIHYNELFAGVLAHDLRTPLGAIMTAAQLVLMRQEGEGDRNAKPLSRILASGQRMTRMIDQLLDFTRARVGGGIEVQPRETNLADLCSQAVAELELAYPDWKIEHEVLGDQGGSWDPDRLLQIISNLVANAGQHGSAGSGILIKLDGLHADAVIFEIRNRGAIPESLLPNLFDPFRGTHHRRDHSRGLGLGLFIVKEIVRAHGGTVDVTSSEAEGTTFTIRLPRQAPIERRACSDHSSLVHRIHRSGAAP